jgi:photosystem II stability/assembly factor-like uncharacterized protein
VRFAGAAVLTLALSAGCERIVPEDEPPVQVIFPVWSNQQRVPTSSHLRAVRFLSQTVGYVAGEDTSIFRTSDGGATWNQLEHSPLSRGGDIAAMDFFKDGAEVHVGTAGRDAVSGGRWWTSGDGLNFTTPDEASTGFAEMTAIDLVAPGTAYTLAQDGTIRAVTTSSVSTFTVGAAGTWLALSFWGTSGTGYAAGGGGAIRKTSTNGASWVPLASGTPETLRDLAFVSAAGYACGDAGTVVRTTNGTDWSGVPVGAAVTLRGVHFIDALTGWVVGDGGFIRRTVDGGASWAAPAVAATSRDLYDVWFVNASVGYAVGDYGTVVKTADGGARWTEISKGSLASLNAVDFTGDGVKGLAVGNGGLILRTLDRGARWAESPSGVIADLLGVSVPDNGSGNVAYACGAGGTILKTSDFGATWSAMTSGTGATLRAILFPSGDGFGYCAGDGSTILHTSAGVSWAPQSPPVAADYHALAAPFTGLTAYAAGTGGAVAYTEMSGTLWLDRSMGVSTTVRSLQAPSGSVVFAAGTDGKIHRSLLNGQAGTWEVLTPAVAPNGIVFTGLLTGWSVNGGIFVTEDGGPTWDRCPEHTRWTLLALWMNFSGVGCAVGDNGTVLRIVTGGR